MRLLLLNYEYPPIGGGGGFGCEKLVQSLAKHARYQITVLTAGIGTSITESTDAYGVRVIRLPCARAREHRSSASFGFMLTYVLRAVRYVWQHRHVWRSQFEVISTQFAIPTGPAGWVIARILRCPNVLTLHGGELFSQPLELDGYGFPITAVVRFIINQATVVHANSSDTKNAARRFLGIKKNIHVISTGFSPPETVLPEHKIVTKEPRLPIRFIMVSRLVERKGLIYLLQVLSQIDKSLWHLTLVGDGPEESMLRSFAADHGLTGQIEFVGFVSEAEKFQYLHQADVFVLPTLHEGLGLVYFEAMYAGLPIITTDNGGQTDFLTPEENALLVPIRDVPALIKAIKRSIEDREWRRRCGENNRHKIESLKVEKLVQEYDNLFRCTAQL